MKRGLLKVAKSISVEMSEIIGSDLHDLSLFFIPKPPALFVHHRRLVDCACCLTLSRFAKMALRMTVKTVAEPMRAVPARSFAKKAAKKAAPAAPAAASGDHCKFPETCVHRSFCLPLCCLKQFPPKVVVYICHI